MFLQSFMGRTLLELLYDTSLQPMPVTTICSLCVSLPQFILFLFTCVCVCVCIYECMPCVDEYMWTTKQGTRSPGARIVDSYEHLASLLGAEFQFSGRTIYSLNCWVIYPSPPVSYKDIFIEVRVISNPVCSHLYFFFTTSGKHFQIRSDSEVPGEHKFELVQTSVLCFLKTELSC